MVYQPLVLPALQSLGILEKVKEKAFLNREGIFWRDVNGNVLAKLPMDDTDSNGEKRGGEDFEGILLLGQERMTRLILESLEEWISVHVMFGYQACGVDQQDQERPARVLVRKPKEHSSDDEVIIEAEYVIAADGANSTIRRAIGIPFEGFTWPNMKMIGADIYYDFIGENGYGPLNFIVDAVDWAVIAYSGQDETGQNQPYGKAAPLWRLAYSESPELSDDKSEIMARAEERLKRFNIKGDYRLSRAEPYRLQQRCAALARIGKVLLAGDALHSNNPIGGLGMTTGILDAVAYGNALTRVINGGEPDELLTRCASVRRDAWIRATNETSIVNLKRLYSTEEDVVEARNNFFKGLNDDANFARLIKKRMNNMAGEDFGVPQ
ncbi:MAG: hypothetical protein Q9160_003700 [Pyrenula sp. 1 TL-2023]